MDKGYKEGSLEGTLNEIPSYRRYIYPSQSLKVLAVKLPTCSSGSRS